MSHGEVLLGDDRFLRKRGSKTDRADPAARISMALWVRGLRPDPLLHGGISASPATVARDRAKGRHRKPPGMAHAPDSPTRLGAEENAAWTREISTMTAGLSKGR